MTRDRRLLAAVGGPVTQLAGRGGWLPAAVAAGAALAKVVAAGLELVLLARPVHRVLRRWVVAAMGVLLTLYGGVLVGVGGLSLAGVFGAPPADPVPLRWHVALWDAWFLLWGVLVLAAVARRRRLYRPAA